MAIILYAANFGLERNIILHKTRKKKLNLL